MKRSISPEAMRLFDEIEEMLKKEGLLAEKPEYRVCHGCREACRGCSQFEGEYMWGLYCADCWDAAGWIEDQLHMGNLLRKVRIGDWKYAVFLVRETGRRELWIVTPQSAEKQSYEFDPGSMGDDALIEKLKTYLLFS